ncbi:MAG: hypothetical protein ACKN9D_03870 [Actinomycetales bacterium]
MSFFHQEHGGDPYGAQIRQNKEALGQAGEGADPNYDAFFSNRRSSFDDAPTPAEAPPEASPPSFQPPVTTAARSDPGAPMSRSRLFDQPRSHKVMGQYWSTFGERRKATGGGIRGFMSALMGRGMWRANKAKYGIYA